jgi:2-dehydropantoate 2-reductase
LRYLVIGAGAVGGTIGGHLSAAGRDVVLVARGAHLEALRANGLLLRTPAGDLRPPAAVAGSPDDVTPRADDVLVLTTKTQDTARALGTWAAAAAGLPVLCAQNGVENERLALRRCGRVYGVNVWLPATHTEPGVVRAGGTPHPGMLHVGRYPSGAGATAGAVVADLEAAGFVAAAVPDAMRWKYAKLVANTVNALEALAGSAAYGTALEARAREEAYAVLDAAGIPYASEAEQRAARGDRVRIAEIPGAARVGSSTFQSLARGTGSVEADYLNGEIALLGRLHGVPTPVNSTLQALAGQFARDRRPPGTLDLAALEAAVAAA